MYLLKECQRRLQRPARELLEAPDIRDESFRPVDVVALEESTEKQTEPVVQEEAQPDFADNDVQADDCYDSDEDEAMEPSETASEEEPSTAPHSVEQPVLNSVVQPVLNSAEQC